MGSQHADGQPGRPEDGHADWTGHVIVCGLHDVAFRIVEELTQSGVPAVVIDDDPDRRLAPLVAAWGVPHVQASARVPETLAEAGLDGAAAVVCAYDDDLRTLEAALLARRLSPDVRVVAQLANPAVGRALKETGVAVLDVAGLSAPAVVEACRRSGVQEMTLSGERFLAVRVTAPRAATLRELYGALAPVAVVPAAGGEVTIAPGRDVRVAPGDEVTLIATPEELNALSPEWAAPSPATLPFSPTSYPHQVVVSLLRAADRRLGLALTGLLAVVTASTVVLRVGYELSGHHISVLQALYFTMETITTVGYGDFTFNHETPWLIAFAVALMATGALFVAVFFAMLTNLIVSRRIEESLGRQKITGLRGHVLVIGLGTVGIEVVERLVAAGSQVVVVEKDEHNRHLGQARALGVPVVIADATQPRVLASVRLSTASAVAVLTSDDMANLETGLAVRDQLGPRWEAVPVVLRIFDPQFARSVKETFGFRNVRSTAALAAPWFVGAALGLEVLSTFYAGDEPLLVARLTVTPGGGLHGLPMRDLAARTRVLAIRRAAEGAILEHPPRRSTTFQPDDEAYLIGPYDELLTVLHRDRPSPPALGTAPVPQAGSRPSRALLTGARARARNARRQSRRLIGMTWMPGARCLIMAACVTLLVAGCAAVTSSTTPATPAKGLTTRPAAESATIAGPGATPQQVAQAEARTLLADFVPPPGAKRLPAAPGTGGVLDQPTSVIVSSAEVDEVTFWLAPGQPQAALAWEQAHLPRAFTPGDSDSGPPSWDRMFQLTTVPAAITDAELVVKVAGAGNGQTGIRVDAEVAWQPPRPASTLVPATARVVTLAEAPLLGQHPKLPSPVTITSEPVVRQLAALVNGLRLSTMGAAACPIDFGNALLLTFRARPGGPPLAVAEGPETCGTVVLTIHGKDQPALQVTGSFTGSVLNAAGLHWQVP
jgi:Trk K+ transport system NAD-binding subunit